MAYTRKTRSRTRARSGTYRSRSAPARGRKTYTAKRRAKKPVARKRYRATAKPQVIRIEMVNSAGSGLSPYEQQLQTMREKTATPKKARF